MADMEMQCTVELSPHLGGAAVEALLEQLSSHRGANLVVDASKVKRVGAQCLQVILSASRTWAAEGVGFRIDSPSERFSDVASGLGLDEIQKLSSENV